MLCLRTSQCVPNAEEIVNSEEINTIGVADGDVVRVKIDYEGLGEQKTKNEQRIIFHLSINKKKIMLFAQSVDEIENKNLNTDVNMVGGVFTAIE